MMRVNTAFGRVSMPLEVWAAKGSVAAVEWLALLAYEQGVRLKQVKKIPADWYKLQRQYA